LGTDKQRVKRVDGLTNNQAEYWGLIAVLQYLAEGSCAVIRTDSQLLCEQFNSRWAVNDAQLLALLSDARKLIREKKLDIDVRWIPREENVAGKLLDRG
jgi:ribonuclease HI